MFWTYTILSGLCAILAVVFGMLATHAEKKEEASPLPVTNTILNVKGDYVNKNKTVKTEKTNKVQKPIKSEPLTNKSETIINNGGIVNSGINNGTQTVNNYSNEREPRKLNSEDISTLKTIPLDYRVQFMYVNSSEESTNYANEIFIELNKLNYNIIEVNSVGMYLENGGKPHVKGERIYLTQYPDEKRAVVLIREQK